MDIGTIFDQDTFTILRFLSIVQFQIHLWNSDFAMCCGDGGDAGGGGLTTSHREQALIFGHHHHIFTD